MAEKRVLQLAVEGQYFKEMLSGLKTEEFRIPNQYWTRRLVDREYDEMVITWGYPSKTDKKRRITMPYRGYRKTTITHPHFGAEPQAVFAIAIAPIIDWDESSQELAREYMEYDFL